HLKNSPNVSSCPFQTTMALRALSRRTSDEPPTSRCSILMMRETSKESSLKTPAAIAINPALCRAIFDALERMSCWLVASERRLIAPLARQKSSVAEAMRVRCLKQHKNGSTAEPRHSKLTQTISENTAAKTTPNIR